MLSFVAGKALILSVFIISTEYCYNLSIWVLLQKKLVSIFRD